MTTQTALRRREVAVALAGLPVVGAITASRASDQPSLPSSAPPVEPQAFDLATPLGQTADGKTLTLNDLPERALVVCFWAAWCPHCRAELPMLERLQHAVSAERLRVVLVNTEPASDWRRVRRQLEGKFTALLTHDADGAVRKAFAAPGSVPHTVVLGRDGHRYATLRGWSDDRLDWLVERANEALAAPAR